MVSKMDWSSSQAQTFGDLHEEDSVRDDNRRMDLHNNAQGRGLAQYARGHGNGGSTFKSYVDFYAHLAADEAVYVGIDAHKWWVRVK